MSGIIIDKLRQIDKASRDDGNSYSMTASASSCSLSSGRKSKSNRASSDQQSTGQNSSAMRSDESEYYEAYHVAKVWAGKLRKLPHCQKLYAEKAIHDILFEAQLGNLHKSSVKINGKITLTKSTSGETSNSRSSYTSKTTSSPLSLLEHRDSDHVAVVSSEVLISESYPNENCLSSESNDDSTKSKKLCKVTTTNEHIHNQTFIVAASPNLVRQASSNTESFSNQIFDENIADAATNTPDCILKQLSRYIRDCYDNCKHYLPPTQQ